MNKHPIPPNLDDLMFRNAVNDIWHRYQTAFLNQLPLELVCRLYSAFDGNEDMGAAAHTYIVSALNRNAFAHAREKERQETLEQEQRSSTETAYTPFRAPRPDTQELHEFADEFEKAQSLLHGFEDWWLTDFDPTFPGRRDPYAERIPAGYLPQLLVWTAEDFDRTTEEACREFLRCCRRYESMVATIKRRMRYLDDGPLKIRPRTAVESNNPFD
ncbi:MAG: hypothetical protein ACI4X9_07265 [Kiritimatiellia bacterium]